MKYLVISAEMQHEIHVYNIKIKTYRKISPSEKIELCS